MGFFYRVKLLLFTMLVGSTLFLWIQNRLIGPSINLRQFLSGKITSEDNYKARCSSLIQGDVNEILRAKKYMKENPRKSWTTPEQIINMAKDCNSYKKNRTYILEYLTEEERNFPIAYSIMMYKDIEQVERLLRAIYRPQNYYCIHVDKKTAAIIHKAIRSIASCFSNVFVLSKPVDVNWGGYSVLEPCIKCLHELSKYKNWKYFINLSGQEFPIRTNYELVRIFKVYNGTNDVGSYFTMGPKSRYDVRILWVWQDQIRTKQKNIAPPHGINLYKGAYQVVLARSFVDYVINNKIATDFLTWVKTSGHPDETYFNSLNRNPQLRVPGAPRDKGKSAYPDYSGRYIRRVMWQNQNKTRTCYGKFVRNVCIMGVGDLQSITKSPALFVNKFHLDFEPLALDCMEEWLAGQTRTFYNEPWMCNKFIRKYS